MTETFWIRTLEITLLSLGFLFLLGSLDDLLIDLAHFLLGLRPRSVSRFEWDLWKKLPERPMAIMIPAWKEHSVLEAMVKTNLHRLAYRNYRFFVGVYPNDLETLTIAKDLERRYPELVTVVVTDRPGPTSKAHCLNCILRVLQESTAIARRAGAGWIPYYVAIHDAEDVIHPKALKAINALEGYDFVQVPIFSLPVPLRSWVAGTYLDEFAEIHLKEVPVREALRMPVPSAGVGTFFLWSSLQKLCERFGYGFDENNLTEDYEISLRMARLGAKQHFLLLRDEETNEVIATREYFPDSFGRSIRQKTRWTTGIGLQTWKKWHWMGALGFLRIPRPGDLPILYALWRDRKSLWSNPVSVAGWAVASVTAWILLRGQSLVPPGSLEWQLLRGLFIANAALFAIRIVQRARFCGVVYGPLAGILSMPRLILSTVINALASLRAIRDFTGVATNGKVGQPIKWDKTDHKFPEMLIPDNNGVISLSEKRKEIAL